ncbi:MAG: VOC family protein [Acidobacteriota bacterium]|nr:VOC family protein [Acidobacteriota bacterium]
MTPKQLQRLSRISWFEIPATDLDRATRFYETILQTSLKRGRFGNEELSVFPYEAPAVSGCLIAAPNAKTTGEGVAVFLNADPSLDAVLARVPEAGGSVIQGRTELGGDMGCFARIVDSEGNGIGLHAVS